MYFCKVPVGECARHNGNFAEGLRSRACNWCGELRPHIRSLLGHHTGRSARHQSNAMHFGQRTTLVGNWRKVDSVDSNPLLYSVVSWGSGMRPRRRRGMRCWSSGIIFAAAPPCLAGLPSAREDLFIPLREYCWCVPQRSRSSLLAYPRGHHLLDGVTLRSEPTAPSVLRRVS